MTGRTGRDHAVVLGGSLAGLLAARALAPHFDRITVLERDHFPSEAGPRVGVPQARHVHTLLIGGHAAMESLLPGFDAALAEAGAPRIDWPQDCHVHSQFGWWPRYPSDLVSRFASRDLIEHVIRQLVSETDRITIEEGTEAVGVIAAPGGVGGVQYRRRGGGDIAEPGSLPADLVVDACGRSTKVASWLESLGFPSPPETAVDAHVGYASRYVHPPDGFDQEWKLLLVRNLSPGTRGGGIYLVEGDRWIVTLGGFAGDYPGQEEPGFLAFATSLGVPEFSDALRAAEPLTPIVGYRRTVNVLRHFDLVQRWPAGFVAVGDSVCGFNPVYAQGMSVAALGARLLGRTFESDGSANDVEWRFQARLARLLRDPWDLAVHEDYRYPGTEGPRPSRMAGMRARYEDQVLRAVVVDPVVHRTFVEVLHMLRPVSDLVRPGIASRVARARLRRPAERLPRRDHRAQQW
jgi:2-polyprenyl-6-methoxyphenol hydroxylase-like FAD-dependent oxidoreductase